MFREQLMWYYLIKERDAVGNPLKGKFQQHDYAELFEIRCIFRAFGQYLPQGRACHERRKPLDSLVRMRSPVQIWLAAPKPTRPGGFSFCGTKLAAFASSNLASISKSTQPGGYYCILLLDPGKGNLWKILFRLPIDKWKLSYIMSLRNGESREIDMNQSVSNSE